MNTAKDSANCGQCGNKCDIGEICNGGKCETGIGATYCDDKSMNTSIDSANCGQCGKKCDVGEICNSGKCKTGTGATY